MTSTSWSRRWTRSWSTRVPTSTTCANSLMDAHYCGRWCSCTAAERSTPVRSTLHERCLPASTNSMYTAACKKYATGSSRLFRVTYIPIVLYARAKQLQPQRALVMYSQRHQVDLATRRRPGNHSAQVGRAKGAVARRRARHVRRHISPQRPHRIPRVAHRATRRAGATADGRVSARVLTDVH